MAFSLPPPRPWRHRGWKVKIYDCERLEPPHVTILFRTKAWRIDLRSGEFLDREPPPRDVPPDVIEHIHRHREHLCREWDVLHPENPVTSQEADDERRGRHG
jgi:hypothetical protein